jgi:hypothetical protein
MSMQSQNLRRLHASQSPTRGNATPMADAATGPPSNTNPMVDAATVSPSMPPPCRDPPVDGVIWLLAL